MQSKYPHRKLNWRGTSRLPKTYTLEPLGLGKDLGPVFAIESCTSEQPGVK